MRALFALLFLDCVFGQLPRKMDADAEHFGQISRRIWEFAEVGYKEERSSALLKGELRNAGFRIEENIGGIPTAFTATWGEGKPVVAILGEYDALPGLSQADVPSRKPLIENGPGHGCGHNLLGAGSAFAAIALRREMEQRGLRGKLRFYGTPAEEGGAGKVFMIRAGAFRDVDVALAWHPGDSTGANLQSSLANINAKFRFHGVASHAAMAPEAGRSALDAALLFNHAVDMMREHVPQETRIHYIITNGGSAPNIVPDFAEVYLYARHPSMPVLDGIWKRILKCAEGAALATETRSDVELVSSIYNTLPNRVIGELYERHLRELGGIQYTPEETAFARQIEGTYTAAPAGGVASTDLGDVSWTVPTTELNVATQPPGAPLHSWQATACSGSSMGRKGMAMAAKVLAMTGLDLFTKPELIAAAHSEFEKQRKGIEYRSRIPEGQKPPLNYRGK